MTNEPEAYTLAKIWIHVSAHNWHCRASWSLQIQNTSYRTQRNDSRLRLAVLGSSLHDLSFLTPQYLNIGMLSWMRPIKRTYGHGNNSHDVQCRSKCFDMRHTTSPLCSSCMYELTTQAMHNDFASNCQSRSICQVAMQGLLMCLCYENR